MATNWTVENLKAETAPQQERTMRKVELAGTDLANVLREQHWPPRHHPILLEMLIHIIEQRDKGLPFDVGMFRKAKHIRKPTIKEMLDLIINLNMVESVEPGLLTPTEAFDPILRYAIIQAKMGNRTLKIQPDLSKVEPFNNLPDLKPKPVECWYDMAEPIQTDDERFARQKAIRDWMAEHRLLIPRFVEQMRKDKDKRRGYTLGLFALLLAKGPLTRQELLAELASGRNGKRQPAGGRKALMWLRKNGIVAKGPNPHYSRPTDDHKAFGVKRGFAVMFPFLVKKATTTEKKLAKQFSHVGIITIAKTIWPV